MSLVSDVKMLKEAPLPEVRQAIAEKVTMYLKSGIFDESEASVACDVVRLLAKDVETRVRKILSENLKSLGDIPHDIALLLAQDVAEVSVPMLEFSTVLTEGDLLEIIRSTRQVAQLIAISRRKAVAEVVSSALVHTRNEQVVVSLCNNKTAKISEESLKVVIEQFQDNTVVVDSLVNRGGLPLGIVEKMVTFISSSMRDKLTEQYELSETVAGEVMNATREQATLGLLYEAPAVKPLWVDHNEQVLMVKTEQLVKHLHKEGRLTQSIILRALCEGNLRFFEASMAIFAGVPIMNARTLIRDKNKTALEALCKKAKLPSSSLQAVNIIIEFAIKEQDKGTQDYFKKHLIEHVVGNGYDKTIPLMPYILALIGSKIGAGDVAGSG